MTIQYPSLKTTKAGSCLQGLVGIVLAVVFITAHVSARGEDKKSTANELWVQVVTNSGDRTELFGRLQDLAQRGDADSQYFTGKCLSFGLGVARNNDKAIAAHRRAAAQKHLPALRELAVMYGEGWGVKQDDEEKRHWLRKLAEQDDLFGVTWMHYDAFYADRDGKTASHLHERLQNVAEKEVVKGNYRAFQVLDRLNKTGLFAESLAQNVGPKLSPAYEALFRAALNNDPEANFDVGHAYEFSFPGPKQHATAVVWYERAFALGHYQAANRISHLHRTQNLAVDSPEMAKKWRKIADDFEYDK